ncbi:MAG TPA: hypothetical protein DCM08_01105 [Microscillaceae bacterium]|nr:hypothetical protein [Microscillaceae bacterium]
MRKENSNTGLQKIINEMPLENQKELIAGASVKNKGGGPEMVLVGFTTNPERFKSKEVYENWEDIKSDEILLGELSVTHLRSLAMKVIVNDEGRYGYKKTFTAPETYQHTSFDDWTGFGNNPFYCLCKYWSNKEEAFKHALFLPSELLFL